MKEIISRIRVSSNASIKEAMKTIDRGGLGIAFVIDKNRRLLGVVSDGDIRKAILQGVEIGSPVRGITNTHPAVIKGKFTEKEFAKLKTRKDIIPSAGTLKIPVIDEKGYVKDIVFLYADEHKNIAFPKSIKRQVSASTGVKKILIIGGAGYLGSVLSRKLLKSGYKVRVLDNLTYGDHGIKELYHEGNFTFLAGDCHHLSPLIEAMKRMDAIIHLAAIVGDPACAKNPEETLKTNYLATKLIAEAAKFNQINRFLFASSCSVYGASKTPDERLKESSPLNPVSLYAKTKLKSEEALFSLADDNFSPTIFRFATLYGVSPRMRFDLVINSLTAKAVKEGRITIFGGNQFRPFLEVSDAASACLLWLSSPLEKVGKEVFNVGSDDQNHQIIEIGKIIKTLLPDTILEIKKEISDRRDYNVSFDKVRKLLGFNTKKRVEHGVKEIASLFNEGVVLDYSHTKYHNEKLVIV